MWSPCCATGRWCRRLAPTLYAEPADLGVGTFVGEAVVLPATVRGGCAEAVLGALPVAGPDGGRQVLLRPEQLVPGTPGPVEATVVEVVFHGDDTTVLLALDGSVLRCRTAEPCPPTGLIGVRQKRRCTRLISNVCSKESVRSLRRRGRVRGYRPPPGWTVAAYRFALDPTPRQQRALLSHCGAARFAYNWAVSWVRAVWDQRTAEQSYGVAESELTPWRSWSLPALRRQWNQVKADAAPWWAENSKEAYNTGLAHAAAAFGSYRASRNGSRAGPRVGKPRRKRKHTAGLSCRFTTGAIRVEPDRKHVTLPRLGLLKTHESTRKLARRLEASTAKILSATVSRRGGRWFCSLQVAVQRHDAPAAHPDAVIGVDLGVSHLAVLSAPVPGVSDENGFVPNPRHLDRAQKRLRRLNRRCSRRRGPDRRSRQAPSNRWRRANHARNGVHHRVAHLRGDKLGKLTTALAAHAGTLVVEDLNVAGMLRNRRLARRIADASWGTLRRQLGYKTGWRGGKLHVANRWYPSSKTCSDCGAVKAKLPLRIRVFTCDHCGVVLDRDLNAARNLAQLAAGLSESGTGVAGHPEPSGLNGRLSRRKTPPRGADGVDASTPQRASA